jgi:ribulose 1,5-bisphosphate synthetase/thiazole synthase
MRMRTIETDVLVVGVGPTGLRSAALLAGHGMRTTGSTTPPAHCTTS